jgi:hypothetical protein
MSQAINSSIAILFLRGLYRRYDRIEQGVMDVYHYSRIYRLTKGLWGKIEICFKYSFLGRITEIKETEPALLDDSRVVRYLINFYKGWRNKAICYLMPSFTLRLAKDTKEELIFSPVRTISLIVIITSLVNAVLSVLLQKQMGLWSFFVRVLFLLAGTAGLSCEADWPMVKKSSIFLKKIGVNVERG